MKNTCPDNIGIPEKFECCPDMQNPFRGILPSLQKETVNRLASLNVFSIDSSIGEVFMVDNRGYIIGCGNPKPFDPPRKNSELTKRELRELKAFPYLLKLGE